MKLKRNINHGLSGLLALMTLTGTSPVQAAGSDSLFTVDKSVTPIRRELPRFKDGKPRMVAAIADDTGAQQEFVEDEVMVATDNAERLAGFLARWRGQVLATYRPKRKGDVTRRLVRINTDLALLAELERSAQEVKFKPQARYRATTARGLRLLAAVATEKKSGKKKPGASEKASDYIGVDANWVPYHDSVTGETLSRFAWLDKALAIDCGHMLSENVRLLRQVIEGGPGAATAQLQLEQQIPADGCAPTLPTFALTNGLVLPEVEAGSDFLFVLQPPANVPQGFTADIVASQGGHVSQAPHGGTLYGGSVYVNGDGKQLALATYPTFVLPECARSERFTIRLTHANGTTDFEVTLPVRLAIPGMGIRTFSLSPGANVSIPLCAAGERGAIQWSWIQHSGDPLPPPGMSLVTLPDGNAAITGTAQANSYHAQGALRVEQGNKVAGAGIQMVIDVGFAPILGAACAQHRVTPEEPFVCELPRPLNYNSSTWTLAGGTLPAGVTLVQHGLYWQVEGTVPFWWSACPICDPHDSVGAYSATFNLTVPGFNGVVAIRDVTIDVGIPFNVLTQNTILRPSALPGIANTGDDNEERTQMLLDRINSGTFDIIALQEVFDEEQRDQLSLGVSHNMYDIAWGPDEADLEEESGVATVVKDTWGRWSASGLLASTYNYVFGSCDSDDCWANKGFSVVAVKRGASPVLHVVNTHLQSQYDFDDQYSSTRLAQLNAIMDYLHTIPDFDRVPALLLGDLNIRAGQSEYNARLGDALAGWQDAAAQAFGNPELPYTDNKIRNAYGHFWLGEVHIREHELEDIAIQQGTLACLQAAGTLVQACVPPIPHPLDPADRKRLDYIMIHQGTEYQLEISSVQMEDTHRMTDMCRSRFQPQFSDPGHGDLRCYLSDHFGLSATLRLVKHP